MCKFFVIARTCGISFVMVSVLVGKFFFIARTCGILKYVICSVDSLTEIWLNCECDDVSEGRV